jgi:hypothetical protein
MTAVNQYKIYCETEAQYVTGWSTSSPTVCYNNNTHTVNANSVQLLDTVNTAIVSIKEDKLDIGRNTMVASASMLDVAPNSTVVTYYTFPISVSMYSFSFVTDSTNKGDELSIYANEDTTLGLIGANVNIGVTSLTAPIAFSLYGSDGFYATITDGVNTDYLGMVLTMNKNTNVITFSNATTHAFSSANTLFKMTVRVFDSVRIGGPGVYKFFDDVIGGAAIPAGTAVKLSYKNNASTGDNKELTVYLSCLY